MDAKQVSAVVMTNEQQDMLEQTRIDLCKHHRVVQIAPEPGFESACAIGYQASLKCHSQRICECEGYESGYAIAMATSTPEAATLTEPAICAESRKDSPQSDADRSQDRRGGLSWVLDRISVRIVRALPRLHIEDDKLKV
jgi:hypothetical protein